MFTERFSLLFLILALLPFYLLGCFPSARLVSRRAGLDILEHGSGNPGAANVARVLGLRAGLLVLTADIAKGALAVFLADSISDYAAFPALAGLAAVLGHCFPLQIFPRFTLRSFSRAFSGSKEDPRRSPTPTRRGGKGVATALGVCLVLAPAAAGIALAIFGLCFGLTRISSLSSVLAAAALPIILFLQPAPGKDHELKLVCLSLISLLVLLRHRENLERLAVGNERKFELAKSASVVYGDSETERASKR